MFHKSKLFRLLSYLFVLLLVVYFTASGFGINNINYLLYLATVWFFIYGILQIREKSTSTLYKFYIVNNLFIIPVGLIMHLGFQSSAGLLILMIAVGMMAFVITFSRKEQS